MNENTIPLAEKPEDVTLREADTLQAKALEVLEKDFSLSKQLIN